MNKQVILISGISGAGKTTISNMLEDMGFHCIDQFPSALIESLGDYILINKDPRFNKLVLTTNLLDFEVMYNYLSAINVNLKVILLDANNEVLLNRYKFTRRIHPFLLSNRADSLEMAIHIEKKMLDNLYEDLMIKIDTTSISSKKLRKKLEELLELDDKSLFKISFQSFGFKYGVAKDADLVFDVRFLDNPFYNQDLREFTGLNDDVYDFVMDKDNAREFIQYLERFLDYLFKQYEKEGKRHISVAIGCTGGKHRSVSVVRYLYDKYRKTYQSFINHRDIEK